MDINESQRLSSTVASGKVFISQYSTMHHKLLSKGGDLTNNNGAVFHKTNNQVIGWSDKIHIWDIFDA